MTVICFSSLKGGVGKTSVSINVAHAFAERGCETVLIDLDPATHATRYFAPSNGETKLSQTSLVDLFLRSESDTFLLEEDQEEELSPIQPVRSSLSIIPASAEYRKFYDSRIKSIFEERFISLIQELNTCFDYIVIDTPPDYNTLTESALRVSDLAVVPVDSSSMSIAALEELISEAENTKEVNWAVLRTMVNRMAARVQRLAKGRLEKNIELQTVSEATVQGKPYTDEYMLDAEFENADSFLQMVSDNTNGKAAENKEVLQQQRPIYLLDSIIYRTEHQNRLSFLGKTSFDQRETKKLASQYAALARELEKALALFEEPEEDFPVEALLGMASR